jgi:hypothetical protein
MKISLKIGAPKINAEMAMLVTGLLKLNASIDI